MKKRYKVLLLFLLFCTVCYFVQHWAVSQFMVPKSNTTQEMHFDYMGDVIIIFISLSLYFVLMTLTAVAGFVVSSMRKNKELKAGFGISSIIALTATISFLVYIFLILG